MRNQAPLPRAAHYITPPGRSQATSTRASPSPPMRDPISRSEHRTPEPQQSNRPATDRAKRTASALKIDRRVPEGNLNRVRYRICIESQVGNTFAVKSCAHEVCGRVSFMGDNGDHLGLSPLKRSGSLVRYLPSRRATNVFIGEMSLSPC